MAIEFETVLHVPLDRLHFPEVEQTVQHSETYHLLAAGIQVVEDRTVGRIMAGQSVNTPTRSYHNGPM